MRAGLAWADACIRNISSRGLLVQAQEAPLPGTYIEIRRGTHVIIGRVVWRKAGQFGVHTQEGLDLEAIIDEADRSQSGGGKRRERRRDPERLTIADVARRLEHSRHVSAMIQFIVFMAAGLLVAGLAASAVYELLAAPMEMVEQHLQQS